MFHQLFFMLTTCDSSWSFERHTLKHPSPTWLNYLTVIKLVARNFKECNAADFENKITGLLNFTMKSWWPELFPVNIQKMIDLYLNKSLGVRMYSVIWNRFLLNKFCSIIVKSNVCWLWMNSVVFASIILNYTIFRFVGGCGSTWYWV